MNHIDRSRDAEICDYLKANLPYPYDCHMGYVEGVKVVTPCELPDGDWINVFVLWRDDGFTVTDFGDTLGWLKLMAWELELTDRQRRGWDELTRESAIECELGNLKLRQVEKSGLVDAIQQLGEFASRVTEVLKARPSEIGPAVRV